jgi:alkanesulfonate monooxygenase SsuD/methylene tetrahydromethanopterin reductase-like flavin-dependent oxidoreductase (luciferase family)
VIYDLELNSAAHYPARGVVLLGPEIERAGFDAFWKGEANSPDPFSVLTGLAVGTRTLALGTAIAHIHARSAVTLGVQAATLQDISGGRFLLGVGVANKTIAGWHDGEFERPLERVRGYLDRARRVAAGERVHGSVRPFALAWKPEHPTMPSFLAALGPKMSHLAGEIADGAIVNMATPGKLAEIASWVREGARAAGKDESAIQIIAKVRVTLHADRERARSRLRQLAAFYTVADHYADMLKSSGFEADVVRATEAFARGGLGAAEQQISDSYLDRLPLVAATSLEELFDRLRPFEESGATRIILPYVPASNTPIDEARSFIEAWGRHRQRRVG